MSTAVFTPRAREVRTLILLRHAKSDYPPGVPDHDRPLAARGIRDAPVAGRWLADHCPRPDVVLVSSAERAQRTWELASRQLPVPVPAMTEARIYEATSETLAEIARELPEAATTAVLVGHNPGIEDLARRIARGGDPEALARLRLKYPTSGIAVLQSSGSWADLASAADLVAFAVPRG